MEESEVSAYTSRFNYISNLCLVIVYSKYKKTKTYIWGLTPPVHVLVATFRPTTFESAKKIGLSFDLTISSSEYHNPTDKAEPRKG